MARPNQQIGKGKPAPKRKSITLGSHYYVQWPKGTKWAYIKPGTTYQVGAGRYGRVTKKLKGGWVRIGSSRWKTLQSYGVRPAKTKVARYNPKVATSMKAVNHPSGPVHTTTGGKTKAPKQSSGGSGNGLKKVAKQASSKGNAGKKLSFKTVGHTIGSPNIGKMIPQSLANQLAGLQYDSQIQETKTQIAKQNAQAPQNLADIQNWFGQAAQLNQQAGDRAQQLGNQLGSSAHNATAAVLDAIGAGANEQSGAVGAQGANAEAVLRLLGSTESQARADLAPFLQQQAAGALQAQKNTDSAQALDLQQQLQGLQGQRGNAQQEAILNIINANNQLAQTRFGNKISKLNAQTGVSQLLSGLKAQAASTQGQKIANKQAAQQVSGAGKGWSSYDPLQQAQIIQSAMYDAAGNRRDYTHALNILHAQGFNIAKLLKSYY